MTNGYIAVTDSNDEKRFVNMTQVQIIYPSTDFEKCKTALKFANDTLNVQEDIDTIVELMQCVDEWTKPAAT